MKLIKIAGATVACASLAACLGSSGGGGAGGAGGGAGGGGGGFTFQQGFDAALAQGPTRTALTGTADYTGTVRILTDVAAPTQDIANNSLEGDLAVQVNFDRPSGGMTGTATNFAGKVQGQDTSVTGTLSTATVNGPLNEITAQVTQVPVIGSITTTGMALRMSGDLTDPSNTVTGNANLTLQGQFYGTNGAQSAGVAGFDVQTTAGGAATALTGGTYLLNRN